MRARSVLFLGVLLAGLPAMAEPVPYSVPWFEMDAHSGARRQAIVSCGNDSRLVNGKDTGPVCENANIAENRLFWKRKKLGLNQLNTVEWWRENRDLRAAALMACQRRAYFDRDMLQYCNVAREAEQQSVKKVRG